MKHKSETQRTLSLKEKINQPNTLMKKISLVSALFLCFSFNPAFAQFEGKIQFDNYEIVSGEKQKDDDSFVMFITPDRILLEGNSDKSYKVGGSLETEGILVRHKEKDFVFLTGEKRAMKISKDGITSFMNMFGEDAKQSMDQAESNIKYEKTGESEEVGGYPCDKFIFTDSEKPDERSEVWMTKELDINWGMLSEPWGENMKGFAGSDLPLELIFDEGYFPIKWEQYQGDTLTETANATVSSTDVARSMVELSPDIQIVSLQEYLFEQMRKQQ